MITPLEIETKDFSNSIRGYDKDEVDEFLDEIILDLQALLKDMEELKEENARLIAENEEHRKSQKKVMDTLDSAKRLMKDISDSAEKRADIIIKNAKMDAEVILSDARDRAGAGGASGGELKEMISSFQNKYRKLLKDELENLDAGTGIILGDLERDYMPASMTGEIPDILNEEFGNSFHSSDIEEIDRSIEETDSRLAELEREAEELTVEPVKTVHAPKDTVVIDSLEMDKLLKDIK